MSRLSSSDKQRRNILPDLSIMALIRSWKLAAIVDCIMKTLGTQDYLTPEIFDHRRHEDMGLASADEVKISI